MASGALNLTGGGRGVKHRSKRRVHYFMIKKVSASFGPFLLLPKQLLLKYTRNNAVSIIRYII